jgi:ketosteroid isomerase-like protein
MSQENVDFVRGLFAAAGEMDKQALLTALPEMVPQTCDPEIEWIEDPKRPDARTYRGHEGVIESWAGWLESFDEHSAELEDVRDCGDRVLVTSRENVRSRGSEVALSQRSFQVLTFRDGKILRYQEFYDEAAAREAAGVSD